MKNFHVVVLAVTMALAVGCKPDGQAPVPVPASSEPAPSVSLAQTTSNGMLTVDPATVDLCKEPDGLMAAKVSWNASKVGMGGTEVWLETPGEGKKLWGAGGAVGSSETGRWLRDGSSVILVNAEDKKELARIQIASKACNR